MNSLLKFILICWNWLGWLYLVNHQFSSFYLLVSFSVCQIKLFHRLTCIYAACKIEENHVSAEELGKGISQDHQMILNNVMIVYQAWIGLKLQNGLFLIFCFCSSMTRNPCFAEFGIWSYCVCTISLSWRFYKWYGGLSCLLWILSISV